MIPRYDTICNVSGFCHTSCGHDCKREKHITSQANIYWKIVVYFKDKALQQSNFESRQLFHQNQHTYKTRLDFLLKVLPDDLSVQTTSEFSRKHCPAPVQAFLSSDKYIHIFTLFSTQQQANSALSIVTLGTLTCVVTLPCTFPHSH